MATSPVHTCNGVRPRHHCGKERSTERGHAGSGQPRLGASWGICAWLHRTTLHTRMLIFAAGAALLCNPLPSSWWTIPSHLVASARGRASARRMCIRTSTGTASCSKCWRSIPFDAGSHIECGAGHAGLLAPPTQLESSKDKTC